MYHLSEQFKIFDLFGQPIRLNFNGSNQYRTATGGILTIIIVALVILFFQSNIILFLQKQNLTALTQTTFEEDPPRVFMNDSQYMFAIRLKQDNFTRRPFFNLTTLFRTTQRLQNGTSIRTNRNVNLIPCTKERFTQLFDKKGINVTQQLINLNIEDWLCPDYNFSMFIGGRFTSEYFDFVRFGIFRCSNNSANNSFFTWKPVCANSAQMSEFIKINSVYTVQIAMVNWQINPQKPENYIQMYLDSSFYYNFLPNQLLRETNVFFKPYNLLTENSLVPSFSDIGNETYLVRESQDYRDIVALGSVNDTQFSILYFRRSPFTKTIHRQFQQFDNLLSYLGGFINTIVLMLGFFVAYYNRQQYIVELSNRIYSFERLQKIQENKEKQMKNSEVSQLDYSKPVINVKSPSNKEIGSIQYKPDESVDIRNKSLSIVDKNQNNLIQLIPIDFEKQESSSILKKKLFSENMEIQDRKIYLVKQIYSILKKGMPIKFDIRFLFNQLTCNYLFKTPEIQLIEKAQDKINHELDVYILLEKISQINLLKELVLTKDQQILFNFAPKPIIRMKDLNNEINSRIDLHLISQRMRRSRSISPTNQFNLNNLASQIKSYDQELEFETELNVYNQLFKAYDKIVQQDTQDNKNKVLFSKLGPQIIEIFEISLMIEFEKTPVIPTQVQRIITKRKSRIEHKQSKVSNDSVESESPQKMDLSRAISVVFDEQRKPQK